jgi:hypothetical protein
LYLRKPYHLASTAYAYVNEADFDSFEDAYQCGSDIPLVELDDLTKRDLVNILNLAIQYEKEQWAALWTWDGVGRDEYINRWQDVINKLSDTELVNIKWA